MKKLLRILGYVIFAIAIIVGIAVAFLFLKFPKHQDPPELKLRMTVEKLQRGEYLARHVVGCLYCHSMRQKDIFGIPIQPGTEGQGGKIDFEKTGSVALV